MRDILKKLSDTQYLVINFLEAPVLAFLLAFIVRYFDSDISNQFRYTLLENLNLPVYIFMSVIVALFMGLSVSSEEIIKDRKILKREAFLNLSRSSYLLSKVGVQFLLSAIQALAFVLVGNAIMGIKGMYAEYWIVLFSAWATANVMGLLISDSFRTVVTIYILIPFLVIPQIILSGIIVRYENLNPLISSPKRIPIYGEIIAARWAYEGLATYQFTNNEYQKQFYAWEKLENTANLKANFLMKELLNMLTFLERNLGDPQEAEKVAYNLAVIRQEIGDEYRERMILSRDYEVPLFHMKGSLDSLYPEAIDEELLAYTREYLTTLKNFYTTTFRMASERIDRIIREQDPEALKKLERDHSNEKLEEMVTNNKTLNYYTEFRGDMIQKRGPVYQDPTNRFIKAHFYAPRKMIAGTFVPTIWINVMVIWFMTLLLYLLLYFRVLKRVLDFLERISAKRDD